MSWITELIGSGGTAVMLVWLAKELISGIIRRYDAKKIKTLEFNNYKQQASFDLKYKVYSDIYGKIKRLQGSIMVFLNTENFYNDYEEALFSKANKKFFDAGNESPEDYRGIYYADKYGRVLININHFQGIIEEELLELNNITSANEFLFSNEQALSIKAIIDQSKATKEKINQVYISTYDNFNLEEEEFAEALHEIIGEFIGAFNSELEKFLTDDLNRIQILIRDTDNLFRDEFDTK